MSKGSVVVTILIVAVIAAIIYFVVFPNIQLPIREPVEEVKYKNDVVTVENYIVDNLAPYSTKTSENPNKVTISFDVKNNGDKPIKWLEVNFFDVPGFEIISNGLSCKEFGIGIPGDERSCVFGDKSRYDPTKAIEPLDTRSVSFTVKTPENINSPTPFTISFTISYMYGGLSSKDPYFEQDLFSGERTALIPVIDPGFKKEPSSKFSQSEPTIGPIVFDIIPSLEREKIVSGEKIKEYWGTKDSSFQTKFVMKKVVSDGEIEDIIPQGKCKEDNENFIPCVKISLGNLEFSGECDHWSQTDKKVEAFANRVVNEKNNTLVCFFKPKVPGGFPSEFTSSITIQYNYNYTLLRKQEFVVYPAIQ